MNLEAGLPVLALVVFLSKELWSWYKEAQSKLSKKLEELNYSVMELKVSIDQVNKHLEALPRMKEDINSAHEKIRHLNSLIN